TSQPDLIIRWEIEGIDKMVDGAVKESPVHLAAGLPWKLVAKKDDGSVEVVLHCAVETEQMNWNCDAKVDAFAFRETDKNVTFSRVEKFLNGQETTDFYFGFADSHLLPANGYCKDGKVTVEFGIIINRVTGVRQIKLPDFSTGDHLSNVILIVGGKKLHLSKEYLAVHSPVFNTMFFGDFVEKNKEEIELEDVSYEEFIELLNVIYPSERQVTVNSYKYLLVLADPFQVKLVTDNVENYLIKTEKVAVAAKLLLADQYKLELLKTHCFNSFEHPRDIKVLEGTDECGQFSDAMINCLFKKVLAIID
ncbi:hypothetical protein PFISCL1PPCAC_20934, partial [Pristionchus fissidentatus]